MKNNPAAVYLQKKLRQFVFSLHELGAKDLNTTRDSNVSTAQTEPGATGDKVTFYLAGAEGRLRLPLAMSDTTHCLS